MESASKIDRLLRLILLLQQDEAGNAPDVAAAFQVSRRTVHRYFEDLTYLGVPWYFDEEAQRYRIGKDFFLPPLHLTAVESLALIALVKQVAGKEQIPLTQPAALAIEKIRSRLMRFSSAALTDEPYVIPPDFSIEAYRGDAWRMIRSGKLYDVAIRFDATMADTVSDTRWHHTQEIEYHEEDDSITFRCRVDGLDEIQYWVLSYGAGAQVIAPPELADRVAAMAKATAQRYAAP